MSAPHEFELFCPHCAATQHAGVPAMLDRLRTLGVLRRQAQPEREVVAELFRNSAARMECVACGQRGLIARPAATDHWPAARMCEDCGVAIPEERLQILPRATRCAACAAGSHPVPPRTDEREFCPRCGEVLGLRLAPRAGTARYTTYCPRCKS